MSKAIDLTGRKFGHLFVVRRTENSPKSASGFSETRWLCKCDCGNVLVIGKGALLYEGKDNCGCIKKPRKCKHGYSNTRLHGIWIGMKQRCLNKSNSSYHNYGGRGITVCDEWLGKNGAQNFIHWALNNGYKDDLTIERIDVNKGYSPDNCRWVTKQEQSENKRNTVWLKNDTSEIQMCKLCKNNSISYRTAYGRFSRNCTFDEIVKKSDLRSTRSGNRKKVVCKTTSGSVFHYTSIRSAVREAKISYKKISAMLTTGEEYKGMTFSLYEGGGEDE